MPYRNKRSNGFTLIEVIVGIAVFVAIAVAAYGAFASLAKLSASQQVKVLALALASDKLELLRNMPYSNLTNGQSSSADSRGGVSFTVRTTIANGDMVSAGTSVEGKLVEVEVECAAGTSSVCMGFVPLTITGRIWK